MRPFLFALLIVLWILWLLPFFLGNRRNAAQKAVVTAPAARWGIVLQGISFGIVWAFNSRFLTQPLSPWLIFPAIAIGILAVVCAWASVPALGKQWRVDAGLNADHELVQSGPYRFVRHPIYASMLGIFLMAGLVLTSWPAFAAALALFIAGIEIRVRIEDRLLLSRFNGQFEDWKNRVPAYVPFIR
ncbi:MAG: isoprenylcysteine carboxylmethyltransferase family protein [Acidobacteriota bacterium]|nr:isoprenylcysteine carboxylmethyltransferase family protein [Acidobacteriota bacterium]